MALGVFFIPLLPGLPTEPRPPVGNFCYNVEMRPRVFNVRVYCTAMQYARPLRLSSFLRQARFAYVGPRHGYADGTHV